MKYIFALPLLLVLSACTMEAEIPSEAKPKLYSCVDLRDNEKFSFWGSDAYNARIEFGFTYKVTCFDIRDSLGRHRTICSNSDYPDHIKCTH